MINAVFKSHNCAVPLSLLLAFAVTTDCQAANDNLPLLPPDTSQVVSVKANKTNLPTAEIARTQKRIYFAHNTIPAKRYSRPTSKRIWANGPTSRVARANWNARAEPVADQYINAIQVYPYSKGTLYRLYTAVGRITDIKLATGETLIDKAAGDTVRWVVGDTTSGTQGTLQTHVLVKPIAAGLKTNLLITTTKRTYHLELVSTRETYMASLSWHYPHSELPEHEAAEPNPKRTPSAITNNSPQNSSMFNFDYLIDGPKVAWKPTQVFDDGRQTFIQFGRNLDAGEAAPLFITDNGQTALVNYRQQGRSYVVDRLFDTAELRLGSGRQQIVRISRMEEKQAKSALRHTGARP